ncbi:MAG: SDR family oxidoreductase [Bryobacterales bacterium]|nr:SDR family oxidoreductase [Bryobacterales bacterium]
MSVNVPLLDGKIALITGGARGIGEGISLRFGREGAAVGVLDLNASAADSVVERIRLEGGRAIALPANVADGAQVRKAVAALAKAFGGPDVLVHNAGIMPEGAIEAISEEQWDRVFAVNVRGAYLTCREVLPAMRAGRRGSIILMASITGVNGFPGLAAYSATKGALISLARATAIDYAAEGIRVNAVSPGTIDSPMLHEFVASQADPHRTRLAFDQVQPRGRVGTIDEVVNVVAFLASDQATYVSGANVIVDGGLSIKGEQPRV